MAITELPKLFRRLPAVSDFLVYMKTNEELLKEAEQNQDRMTALVKKAIANGYKFPFTEYILERSEMMYGHTWWASILYDKSFVKALFGDEAFINERWDDGELHERALIYEEPSTAWEYHIQQAVVSENPINYYWDHLEH